jgi:hypothetical protein
MSKNQKKYEFMLSIPVSEVTLLLKIVRNRTRLLTFRRTGGSKVPFVCLCFGISCNKRAKYPK